MIQILWEHPRRLESHQYQYKNLKSQPHDVMVHSTQNKKLQCFKAPSAHSEVSVLFNNALNYWDYTGWWYRGVYRVLVGKPEGRRPLGRPRRRWVDNIRKDLQEVGCGHMDWIGLAQDRNRWRVLVSAVMNLWVPWNARNFLTSCTPVSCSRRTLHHGASI